MKNFGAYAKAIMAAVVTAASTGLGFLPHTDPWFNVLTGVVAVAGIYGVYAVPNKTIALSVDAALAKILPPAAAAALAKIIDDALNVPVTPSIDGPLPVVPPVPTTPPTVAADGTPVPTPIPPVGK